MGIPIDSGTWQACLHRRTQSRLRVRLAARLVGLDLSQPAILLDLSQFGAKLEAERAGARPGADLFVNWGRFEAFGRVVWRTGRTVGILFDEPLPTTTILATRELDNEAHLGDDHQIARDTARLWVEGVRRL